MFSRKFRIIKTLRNWAFLKYNEDGIPYSAQEEKVVYEIQDSLGFLSFWETIPHERFLCLDEAKYRKQTLERNENINSKIEVIDVS